MKKCAFVFNAGFHIIVTAGDTLFTVLVALININGNIKTCRELCLAFTGSCGGLTAQPTLRFLTETLVCGHGGNWIVFIMSHDTAKLIKFALFGSKATPISKWRLIMR